MFFSAPFAMLHSVAMFFSDVFTGLRLALPKKVGQADATVALALVLVVDASLVLLGVGVTASPVTASGFGGAGGGEQEIRSDNGIMSVERALKRKTKRR
jgi:hypothetical protein